jgi:hypothetical protein
MKIKTANGFDFAWHVTYTSPDGKTYEIDVEANTYIGAKRKGCRALYLPQVLKQVNNYEDTGLEATIKR